MDGLKYEEASPGVRLATVESHKHPEDDVTEFDDNLRHNLKSNSELGDKRVISFEPFPDQYSEGAFREPVIPRLPQHILEETPSPSPEISRPDDRENADSPNPPPQASLSLDAAGNFEDVQAKALHSVGIEGDDVNSWERREVQNLESHTDGAEGDAAPALPDSRSKSSTEAICDETVQANLDALDLQKTETNDAASEKLCPSLEDTIKPSELCDAPLHLRLRELSNPKVSDAFTPSIASPDSTTPNEAEERFMSPGRTSNDKRTLEADIEAGAYTEEAKREPSSTDSRADQLQSASKALENEDYHLSSESSIREQTDTAPWVSSSSLNKHCDGEMPAPEPRPTAPFSDAPPQMGDLATKHQSILLPSMNSAVSYSVSDKGHSGVTEVLAIDCNVDPEFVQVDKASAASDDLEVLRHIRSSAPSPSIGPSEVPAIITTQATPSQTTFADSESVIPPALLPSPTPSQSPPSPRSLASNRLTPAPLLQRMPSQAEKEEAIRLVAELRSETATPVPADSDLPQASVAEEPSYPQTQLLFDLSENSKKLSTSKRKRGSFDGDRESLDNEEDERKEKRPSRGEAPSLTLSIFSGSIIPRKQLVLSILATLGINLLLPFVNGVMLGKSYLRLFGRWADVAFVRLW